MSDFEQTVSTLFDQCLRLKPEEREAFLLSSCPNNPEVRDKVLSLVRSHETTGSFLGSLSDEDSAKVAQRRERVSASDEQAGDQIGRYQLLEKIGEGAWGTVWVAEQTQDIRRKVALKILKLGLDTKEFLSRFEAERQVLAMMDHSSIAKVLDAGATDYGRPYLVMEWVQGLPLLRYADEKELSLTERIELFIKICRALGHAHERDVIHRDIKPSNVLVTEEDNLPIPKIIDFGIAKTNQFQLSDKTLFTNIHTFIGTPLYSSPEQLEFSGTDVDPRSDVYSLGVLLYQFLCGRTPFDLDRLSRSGMENMRSVLMNEDPPRPSVRFADLQADDRAEVAALRRTTGDKGIALLEGDIDWIVMRCLEKDRNRRYSSAGELADDLQAYLEFRPVAAVAPSLAYRTKKFIRRHGLGKHAKVLVPACLLFLAGVVFFILGRQPEPGGTDGSVPFSIESVEEGISVAVLPFENRTQKEADQFFADGFHSEMTSSLSRQEGLRVLSRSSTLAYRDLQMASQAIAQELKVRYLLSGSVQKTESSLLISVELMDASRDEIIWGNSYERLVTSSNLFNLQRDLCRSIANQVLLVLVPSEEPVQKVPTQNLEALQAYLSAKEILDRDVGIRMLEAEQLLLKAVELDPEFALAFVQLARVYLKDGFGAFTELDEEEAEQKSADAAEQAFELDDGLPEVHVAMGIKQLNERDREGAFDSFRRALELDPNHADAIYFLTRSRRGITRGNPDPTLSHEQRLVVAEQLIKMNPKCAAYRFLIVDILEALKRRDEVLEHYYAAVEHNPLSFRANYWLSMHLVKEYGRYDEAMIYLRKAQALYPHRVTFMADIRAVYDDLGGYEEAEQWTLREMRSNWLVAGMYGGNLWRFRGDMDKALEGYRLSVASSTDGKLNLGGAHQYVFNDDLRKGNFEEAIARYEKWVPHLFKSELDIRRYRDAELGLELAAILLAAGQTEQGNRLLAEADEYLQPRLQLIQEQSFYRAITLILSEKYEEAVEQFEVAVKNGLRKRKFFEDARLDPIREEPRFVSLMETVEKDLSQQLANIRQMEANGELGVIPDLEDIQRFPATPDF